MTRAPGLVNRRRDRPVGAAPGNAETAILAATALAVLLCYAWLAGAVADGKYLPASSDEYGYFARAKSFYENGRLTSPYMLEENVSRVGEFSSHGFSYNLFHGLVAKVFGFHALNAIITNLAMLALALGLIAIQRLPVAQRLFLIVSALLYFTLPIYLFSYMQEVMQLLIAVVAGVLLLRVYRSEDRHGRRVNVALFAVVMVGASFFRVSWMLFLFCLVPLAENRRQAVLYAGAAAAGTALIFVYTSMFHAPYPYGFMAGLKPALQQRDFLRVIGLLAGNFGSNAAKYFFTPAPFSTPPGIADATIADSRIGNSYLLAKYLLVALTAACLWVGVRHKDRFALAAALIGLINISSLFLVYDAYEWRDQRSLAPVFYVSLFALASRPRVRAGTVALLLAMFPPLLSYAATGVIPAHRAMAEKYRVSPATVRAFEFLRGQIQEQRTTTVLVSRFFTNPTDIYVLALPLTNSAGYPIRYTFNLLGGEDLRIRKPGFVDYVLVPDVTEGTGGRSVVLPRLLRP